MLDPEAEASVLLADFAEPPSARALIEHHLGPDAVVDGHSVQLVYVNGEPRIRAPARLSAIEARWALCHELAEWHLLEQLDYREPDIEAQAETIAAALVMPREAFRAALPASFSTLARMFIATETAAVLRFAEVTGTLAIVVGPGFMRARGAEGYVMPPGIELQRLAHARRLPPGLRRARLKDDPRRRVLLLAG